MTDAPLPREFYDRNACLVARDLLGAVLVRQVGNQRITGRIVEAEAYTGSDDAASHGHRGRTPRNAPMFDAPGHSYVYLCYGMYWLFNVVCEGVSEPAAVLLRAIEPLQGESLMEVNRRGRARREWTNGPGRLSMAFDIDGSHNRCDLTVAGNDVWVAGGSSIEDTLVSNGPRIGMGKSVAEPWYSAPRRWWITSNPYVSR